VGRNSNPGEPPFVAVLQAISSDLFRKSGAQEFGVSESEFRNLLQRVASKCLSASASAKDARCFFEGLHLPELALAQACADGNDSAWQKFMLLYRAKLYSMALHIAKEDSAAHDLAESVYADLFGLRTRDGCRLSKLSSYTGRGSLEGWLRTVLAQQYIDRYRTQRRLVSLDEQVEDVPVPTGKNGADPLNHAAGVVDSRLKAAVDASLASLAADESFMLSAYYLDQRRLVEIAQMLGVHASSISRRLDKLAGMLRKRIVANLVRLGLDRRRAEELLDVDVRDLEVNVRQHLTQKSRVPPFSKEGRARTQTSNAPE